MENRKMSEAANGKTSSLRKATKGILGGLTFGFILYLAVLFFRVAINSVAGTPLVPLNTEFGGFALGFSSGVGIALWDD
jgi:hypothetical protein